MAKHLASHYVASEHLFKVMLDQLSNAIHGSPDLMKHVHSTRGRIKDPDHLKDKLLRKMRSTKAANKRFAIIEQNLFSRINDLAGFRILHLHTHQIEQIDKALRAILTEFRYTIVEGPTARTWDDETRQYFQSIGIRPIRSPKMYTSVHYVVRPNNETPGCSAANRWAPALT
jgi:putative GTP pyrophosphokinase